IALFPAFKRVYAYIQEQFGLQRPLTQVEKAILCSYYRCVEGCVSDNTDKYCAEFEPSACAEPVANGAYEGDLKVCGSNAEKYPIEVTLTDPKTIHKEIEINPSCIVPTSSAVEDDQKHYIESCANNWIIVDSELVKSKGESETCTVNPFSFYTASYDSYKSVTLKPATVYIFTEKDDKGRWKASVRKTSCDIILEENVPKEVEFPDFNLNEKLICIKNSKYNVSFEYSGYNSLANCIDVTINGATKHLVIPYGSEQSDSYTWYFDPGHNFNVIYKGARPCNPAFNWQKFNITYYYEELPPTPPPSEEGEYLPSDYDSWTESLNGWSPPEEVELKDKTTDPQDVKYGEHSIHMSIEGSNIGFNFKKAGISGGEIDLKNWEKVHFWYKSKHKGWGEGWSISFHVINSWKALRCDIPESEDWKEITIDLKNDCEKINEYNWEKVNWIEFGSSLYNELWIDQFYLFKSA
ncbi:MAG: hypothetical protein ACTSUF_00755, partial [Candidatus Heimdallarchaeaceae archaeon]